MTNPERQVGIWVGIYLGYLLVPSHLESPFSWAMHMCTGSKVWSKRGRLSFCVPLQSSYIAVLTPGIPECNLFRHRVTADVIRVFFF